MSDESQNECNLWFGRAAIAATLAKLYESEAKLSKDPVNSAGLAWLAQRYAEDAVYATAQGIASLAKLCGPQAAI